MRVLNWNTLDAAERAAALRRPAQEVGEEVSRAVAEVLDAVRRGGAEAVAAFTERFDGVRRDDLLLTDAEVEDALAQVDPQVRRAIAEAAEAIRAFHAPGGARPYVVQEGEDAVRCERVVRPVRSVGLYVPAGSAPLPSTALMLGVPAVLAGCPEVVVCTPPTRDGGADPLVVAACVEVGVRRIAVVGGAQAVGAMAFGAGPVGPCDKVFGPGNTFVTEAKRQVAGMQGGPGIDLPAGPSEQLVVADAGANPVWVAADLLSQAEHGPDSQVVCVADDRDLLEQVAAELSRQAAELPRAGIVTEALGASRLVLVRDLEQAVEVSNAYAPEHLILAVREPRDLLEGVTAAGSVFLGDHTPESLGDYCSGTNHVLPTSGAARWTGGVNLSSFQLSITVQEASSRALSATGGTAVALARAEGLEAHARAVTRRVGEPEGGEARA
ncbi:histidinol dehydrogenase [Kytococcus schroeteri]|uniref:histidinol dehydrogenase n=1 Tax=Kytococcus schroeteri TaxID=138300 RepID=UPI0035EDB782